jgi:ABC-type antimicrobial peptide transport system permease subunit
VGIERAIGIRPAAIAASYCLKAIAYAVVGVVLGALAFELAVVPFAAAHPFQFPNGAVTLSPEAGEMRRDGALLVIVAVLAALIPAWRSVRIKILDAIWGG